MHEVCAIQLPVGLDQIRHLPHQLVYPEQRPQPVAIEIVRGIDALLGERLLRAHQPVVVRSRLVP